MQLMKQPAYIAVKVYFGWETFHAIHIYPMSRHPIFQHIEISSLNTPCGHVWMHFLQPVQLSGSLKTMCLCHRNPTLPITCFGQASTHFQQATHARGIAHTCFVWILLNLSVFITFNVSIYADRQRLKIFYGNAKNDGMASIIVILYSVVN